MSPPVLETKPPHKKLKNPKDEEKVRFPKRRSLFSRTGSQNTLMIHIHHTVRNSILPMKLALPPNKFKIGSQMSEDEHGKNHIMKNVLPIKLKNVSPLKNSKLNENLNPNNKRELIR